MPSRITIAGDIGSGKSTIARRLAEAIGVEPLSTGGIQRRLAQARGVTVLELNRLAETDGSIDQEIDGYLMNMHGGDLVVESRMAWKFVPSTLKVYLYISDQEASRRIVGAKRPDEDYSNTEDPLKQILERRKSEVLRFKKYYGVDIDNLQNYDLVVDTTFAGSEEVAKVISDHEQDGRKPLCWMSPRSLVPTQGIRDLGKDELASISGEIARRGVDAAQPVAALYVDHVFYILDGHARVARAARNGMMLVPAVIVASNDQPYIGGLSARRHVKTAVNDSLVHDWEEAVGFRFQDEIWRGREDGAV